MVRTLGISWIFVLLPRWASTVLVPSRVSDGPGKTATWRCPAGRPVCFRPRSPARSPVWRACRMSTFSAALFPLQASDRVRRQQRCRHDNPGERPWQTTVHELDLAVARIDRFEPALRGMDHQVEPTKRIALSRMETFSDGQREHHLEQLGQDLDVGRSCRWL